MLKRTYIAATLAALTLVGCGSDDDEVAKSLEQDGIGFFIDSPVAGISYSTATYQGVTDDYGRYQFESGETVTFSLGDIVLPSVSASKAVHVSDLYSGGVDDQRTINLARLLLTIDSDGEPDNGIQLSAEAVNPDYTPEGLDFSSVTFAADVAQYLSDASQTQTLISEEIAVEHIRDTLGQVEELLAGCGNNCVPRAAFNKYIAGVYPATGQTVSSDTNVSVTLSEAFPNSLEGLVVELFGYPRGWGFQNCRFDWPGMTCGTYGTNPFTGDQFDFGGLDIRHPRIKSNNSETNTRTYSNFEFPWEGCGKPLMAGYTYVVHVFHYDKFPAGEEVEDYKTWWTFDVAGEPTISPIDNTITCPQ